MTHGTPFDLRQKLGGWAARIPHVGEKHGRGWYSEEQFPSRIGRWLSATLRSFSFLVESR